MEFTLFYVMLPVFLLIGIIIKIIPIGEKAFRFYIVV
jgi:hypothetical protein